jgi:hypothetical protein
MRRWIAGSATVLVLTFVASNALAGGLYVGGGIGNTFFSSKVEDALDQIKNIDENATAWKLFGGFSGGKFFGVEGGYRSFGTVSSTVSSEVFESKTSGWDIEGLGRIQISIVDIFAKAGLMFWSTDLKVLTLSFDDSGTDFFWGLGAGLRLGPIGARVEWESVETEIPDNLSMVSLAATFGF